MSGFRYATAYECDACGDVANAAIPEPPFFGDLPMPDGWVQIEWWLKNPDICQGTIQARHLCDGCVGLSAWDVMKLIVIHWKQRYEDQ